MLLARLRWAGVGRMRRHSTRAETIHGLDRPATPCPTLARREMLHTHSHIMQLRTHNLTLVRPASRTPNPS